MGLGAPIRVGDRRPGETLLDVCRRLSPDVIWASEILPGETHEEAAVRLNRGPKAPEVATIDSSGGK